MKEWEKNIRRVVPYVPGEQPKMQNRIKLNTNENPYPPCPAVQQALSRTDAGELRLYPDPACQPLTEALAVYHGLKPEQVFVGVGSDDVLAMAFLTFFNGDKPVLFPDITYSFYPVWADLFRIPYQTPALDREFQIVASDYYRENGGVIFPNPNAPTGIVKPLWFIRDILEHNRDVIVVIDEAYIDFGGETAVPLLREYENLLVVQTYSKSRSMAGMRIGYALGNPELIKAMNNVKYSYNSYTLSRIALTLGVAALEDEEYFRKTVDKIVVTRNEAVERLTAMGFHCLDSGANFLFVTHPDHDAEEIFSYLKEQGIYVRYFNSPKINQYLRITVGLDREMEQLYRALEKGGYGRI